MIVHANTTRAALERANKRLQRIRPFGSRPFLRHEHIFFEHAFTKEEANDLRLWLREMTVEGAYAAYFFDAASSIHLYVDEDHIDSVATLIRMRF